MKPETCYWDEEQKKLIGTARSKVTTFLKKRLVQITDHPYIFLVHPDPTGGRKTTHKVDTNLWTCTCQYNRDSNICTHIKALKLFLFQVSEGGRDLYEGLKRKKIEEENHFGI